MSIILAILGTITVDWLGGYLYNYYKKKQLKRNEDLFLFELELILRNESMPLNERKEDAKELCRMTEGKTAYGAYVALDF